MISFAGTLGTNGTSTSFRTSASPVHCRKERVLHDLRRGGSRAGSFSRSCESRSLHCGENWSSSNVGDRVMIFRKTSFASFPSNGPFPDKTSYMRTPSAHISRRCASQEEFTSVSGGCCQQSRKMFGAHTRRVSRGQSLSARRALPHTALHWKPWKSLCVTPHPRK